MNSRLRILHLEDNANDAELIRSKLEANGIDCHVVRVETKKDFLDAVEQDGFDLVISDYTLPSFDGLSALKIAREKSPDVPFIFVSGTIGEESAIESLLNGATDYVLKHKMTRLIPAVRRALREAEDRKERKLAEEALKASEEYARNIIESSLDMIIAVDKDRKIIQFNKAAQETFGYRPEEVIGQLVHNLYADAAQWLMIHKMTIMNGRCVEEILNRRKNGEIFPSLLAASTLKDSQGRMIGVMGISRDITERKRTEEELQLQKSYFQQLFENSPAAIALLDPNDHIVDVNKAFQKIFQHPLEEIKGHSPNEIIVPEDRLGEAQGLSDESLRGLVVQLETVRKRKDGTLVDVIITGYPILVNDKLVGICGIYLDITERKKLEQQLLRTQRMESIGTLAGGIAHDLNNVLAPILIAVQVLRKKLTDEQSQLILATLESAARRGSDMVKQVLTFARGVEGARQVLQPKHLIVEMEKIVKETFPKSIQIVTDIPKAVWTLSGDATQLHQVLLNFCVNARDAMPKGGTLTIAAENSLLDENYARMHLEAKSGPYVLFKVSDTGMGIPPDIIDKIFDPFFTTKELDKGTGLGLSTVITIVKSHGGFVNVYSEAGKGTTFKVYLPALVTAATVQAEKKQAELPPGRGELILVVDDEASIRDITKQALEMFGYRVMTGNDGTEAVALYAENKGEINVVLTDMTMPFMDGPATIRALQKIDPKVKIIAMSGLVANRKNVDTSVVGVKKFLTKPYTAEELLKTLDGVIREK